MERDQQHHRGRTLAIALVFAFAAALLLARPAHAGSYVVTECSSVSAAAPDARWERSTDHYRPREQCGTDGGLQAYHDAAETGLWHYGAWVWRAPAGTVFTAIQANASLTSQAGHRGQLVATRTSGEPVEFGEEHQDFRVHAISGEFTQFHSWLRCVAGQPCGRAGGDSAHAYVRGIYLRTDDRVAPEVALGGGSLLADAVVRGTRGLAFDAADAGSGVRTVWVEANGTTIATDTRNCGLAAGFATALQPCPPQTTEAVAVSTASDAFVTGPNAVSACAEDLALDGFANRTCEPASVWVDNLCPSSPATGATGLSAGFRDGSETFAVRSDRPARIRGVVAGAGAGATVCALTRDELPEAPIVVGAIATTGAGGHYTLELAPGPSREVFVHHADGDSVIARHGLELRASARPSLAVSPRARVENGDRLRFTGTLPAPACTGRVVKIQARLGGQHWQAFRTGRTSGDCEFAAGYKLRGTRHAHRYRFRALVPPQDGYPFDRGRSAQVSVKVRRRR